MSLIEGKTALVTGTNRGMGEAFVETLVERGAARVYAGIRDQNYLKHFELRFPDVVEPVLLDVTQSEHIKRVADMVDDLDILVNNAGVVHGATVSSEQGLSITQEEMTVNLYGPMQLTNALLSKLKKSSQGVIINLCSIASMSSFSSIGPYSITKAAFHSYTQALRNDLYNTNIQVIGVYPGPTDTRMAEGFPVEKAKPRQIAERSFAAWEAGETDVFPDQHSESWYQIFLKHPKELEKVFGEMNR